MTIVTVSVYNRKNELTSIPQFTPTTHSAAEKASDVNTVRGTNQFDLTQLKGWKVVDYKFEQRGDRYFLSVTFSNEVAESIKGCLPYRNLLRSLLVKDNLWQIAQYVNPNGTIGIALRERANRIKKDGTARKVVPTNISYLFS